MQGSCAGGRNRTQRQCLMRVQQRALQQAVCIGRMALPLSAHAAGTRRQARLGRTHHGHASRPRQAPTACKPGLARSAGSRQGPARTPPGKCPPQGKAPGSARQACQPGPVPPSKATVRPLARPCLSMAAAPRPPASLQACLPLKTQKGRAQSSGGPTTGHLCGVVHRRGWGENGRAR